MITVLINGTDLYTQYGLVLVKKTIGFPEAKTEEIDVPGMDGTLDVTEVNGPVRFSNRQLTFEFETTNLRTFWQMASELAAAYHGKKASITVKDDPDWSYFGRIAISATKENRSAPKVVMDVNAQPYKVDGEGNKCI